MDDDRHWQWWASSDGEHFGISEATRDAVIAAGTRDFGGDPFTIVEATQDGPFEVPDLDDDVLIDRLIDLFSEVNGGRFGEDGVDDFPRVELVAALTTAFETVLAEHGKSIPTYFFTEQRNRELVTPPH